MKVLISFFSVQNYLLISKSCYKLSFICISSNYIECQYQPSYHCNIYINYNIYIYINYNSTKSFKVDNNNNKKHMLVINILIKKHLIAYNYYS
jgi:hypothetical protein